MYERIVRDISLIFNEFRIAPLSFLCNYYIFCKTLKKEGRAFRNIGNKKIYIFRTIKSALLLLFRWFTSTSDRSQCLIRSLAWGPAQIYHVHVTFGLH